MRLEENTERRRDNGTREVSLIIKVELRIFQAHGDDAVISPYLIYLELLIWRCGHFTAPYLLRITDLTPHICIGDWCTRIHPIKKVSVYLSPYCMISSAAVLDWPKERLKKADRYRFLYCALFSSWSCSCVWVNLNEVMSDVSAFGRIVDLVL